MGEQTRNFRNQIQADGNTFDLFGISFEDAIVTILEQEGMKREIAQNADAKETIMKLVRQDERIPERLTSDCIDHVRFVLSQFVNKENGTIKGVIETPQEQCKETTLIDVQNGKLVINKKTHSLDLDYWFITESTIEDGIEMKVVESDSLRNKTIYSRNSDLVTAQVTYNNENLPNITRGGTIQARAEKIGGARYTSFSERIKQIDEARAKGETPDGFLYEGKNPDKLSELKALKNKVLHDYCKASIKFRKLAEKKGLIVPTYSRCA